MKAFLQIQTPAGMTYELPTEPIANHRAAAMLALHPSEFADIEAALADTRELFEDNSQIKDWVSNNMNWDELSPLARLIRYTPPEGEWFNGEFSYHDNRAIMGELDGESVMKVPLELVVTTMAVSQQLCNMTVLNDANGEPMAAVALIIGNGGVINTYVTALQYCGDAIARGASQPAQAAPQTH